MKPLTASATYRLPDLSIAVPNGPQLVNVPLHMLLLAKPVAKLVTAKPDAGTGVARAEWIEMGITESPRSTMISSSSVLFFLNFLHLVRYFVSSRPFLGARVHIKTHGNHIPLVTRCLNWIEEADSG